MEQVVLKMLVEKGWSIKEIGLEVNLSHSTIRYWLNKFGLKTSPKAKSLKEILSKVCPKCNNIFDGTRASYLNHIRWCGHTSYKIKIVTKICSCGKEYETTKYRPRKYCSNHCSWKISDETKAKISKSRKKWLQENPEQHSWRDPEKSKSQPCEDFKTYLKGRGIPFVEEYQPLLEQGRFFSIDVAFPNDKVGIEINGQQHYNRDMTLKTYYQKRHDLIESYGWKLYELLYSIVYQPKVLRESVDGIIKKEHIDLTSSLEYFKYRKENKIPKTNYCDACGEACGLRSKFCSKCARLQSRKFDPSKDFLAELVWKYPLTKIGEMFGVSDNAVKKRCNLYGIERPPRGYWVSCRLDS